MEKKSFIYHLGLSVVLMCHIQNRKLCERNVHV